MALNHSFLFVVRTTRLFRKKPAKKYENYENHENHENEEPADSELNLKIGYKPKKESLHLNYGNMSVPALRQLAKERGLGGEDADLQKLKKKDLMQLLQPH